MQSKLARRHVCKVTSLPIAAPRCPLGYTAFNGGAACCSRISRADTCPNINSENPFLLRTDPVECCDDANTKHCSQGNCRDNLEDLEGIGDGRATCPNSHPYAFNKGLRCCAHRDRGPNCPAIGILQVQDLAECCPNGEERECGGGSARCSRGPPPTQTTCPQSHPYVIDRGLRCCAHEERGPSCPNSGNLELEDPAVCCSSGEDQDCGDGSARCTNALRMPGKFITGVSRLYTTV